MIKRRPRQSWWRGSLGNHRGRGRRRGGGPFNTRKWQGWDS
jgi:hypothetical protein